MAVLNVFKLGFKVDNGCGLMVEGGGSCTEGGGHGTSGAAVHTERRRGSAWSLGLRRMKADGAGWSGREGGALGWWACSLGWSQAKAGWGVVAGPADMGRVEVADFLRSTHS
jgi:hypothetical protein